MRKRRGRWIRLTILFFTLIAGGGAWIGYAYLTDSGRLASIVRIEAAKYLKRARLDLSRVQIRPMSGQVELTHLMLWQTIDGRDFLALRVPWMKIEQDPKGLTSGKFIPREIVIAQPTIRLRRRGDGSWNFEGLAAKSFKRPKGAVAPLVLIQQGTVELATEDTRAPRVVVLRDVSLRMTPQPGDILAIEGSARGDVFDRIQIEGSVHIESGRLTLKGELSKLVVGETLRSRLPAEARGIFEKTGLTGGEIDVSLDKLAYDPRISKTWNYEGSARLRAGVINCSKAPFPISEASGEVRFKNGSIVVERAEGYNGPTTVRAWGEIDEADSTKSPFDINIQIVDLEFDRRLRDWIPGEFANLWNDYKPSGRANLAIHARRETFAGPIGFGVRGDRLDVGLKYHLFPYSIEHVGGTITREGDRIKIDLTTTIGGEAATAVGVIDRPGPNARVELHLHADHVPIDAKLLDALPAIARPVVDQFHPTGTVRADVDIVRNPPGVLDSTGKVAVSARLALDGGCSIRWDGLPYPVSNLAGTLIINPDSWLFRDMKGSNGQAIITGDGWVRKIEGDRFDGEIHLHGRNLPFDQQLRDALPVAYRKSWSRLNPMGSSRVDAKIAFGPGRQDTQLRIVPEPGTRVRLVIERFASPGEPGGTLVFPSMDDVNGLFVFHNGAVTMQDVGFQFLNAPVRFASGTFRVEDSGRFDLGVSDLRVSNFRMEAQLRQLMPKVMAQFALKLDDGKTLAIDAERLRLGWSGNPAEPTWCTWKNALVVLNGNTLATGLPIRLMQGQLDHFTGAYLNDELVARCAINMDSVEVLDQQITGVRGDIEISTHDRKVIANHLSARLLGGNLTGTVEVGLEATTKYSADLRLADADLAEYAKTIAGRQTFRGIAWGRVRLAGVGADIHGLQGEGEAHITGGDLGTLPGFLRLIKVLNLSPATKTLFDSADVIFRVVNGQAYLNPIIFRGDAFSLRGSGTLDTRGELDMLLSILYGRDAIHIPLVSDAMREVGGRILAIHVTGTPSLPKFSPEALHPVSNMLKRPAARRESRIFRD